MNTLADIYYLTKRNVIAQLRIPVLLIFTIVQPLLWLILFSQLFKNMVSQMANAPGGNPYGTNSFLDFFVPAIVMQTVLFSGAWSGTSIITDMENGVLDKMMATPVSRVAIILGRMFASVLYSMLQVTIIFVVAFIMGFQSASGLSAILITYLIAFLFGLGICGLSMLIAVWTKRSEAVMSVSTFVTMPMFMLSGSFLPLALIGGWVANVAKFNPLNYALDATRGPILHNGIDWGTFTFSVIILVVIATCSALARRRK
jgi:ABC-2 type transport system permease protein